MIWYVGSTILAVILIAIASFFNQKKNNNPNEITKFKTLFIVFFILSLLPQTLVSGLRYGIGTDYFYTYYPNFINIFIDDYTYSEKPFVWLNMFLRLMTDNPVWLFLLMALLFTLFTELTIIKISDNWIVSTFLVFGCSFFFVSLNQSRQMVGMAIAMYGMTFILDKKFLKFLIFILLASCFHLSCLIYLPFYFIIRNNFIKKYWLFFAIPILVFTPLIKEAIYYLVSLTKYSYYLEDPAYNTGQYMHAYFVSTLVVEIVGLIYYNRLRKVNPTKTVMLLMFNSIALFFAFLCYFLTIPELFTRLLLMFSWVQIFIIPMLFKIEKFKIALILNILLIAFVTECSLGIIYIQLHHGILPYQSIFYK